VIALLEALELPAQHRIVVYRYTYWDEQAGWMKTSSIYATFEMISNGLGVAVLDSGLEVDQEALRFGGVYIPAPGFSPS
jgi:hypothetical protein